MKARVLFWTGRRANELPLIEVLQFLEYAEDIFEEYGEMFENAVARGVAEVVDNIDL